MTALSDIALIVMILCFIGFAVDMARVARRGGGILVLRFAEFSGSLAVFFGWFAIVYWDRRWNIWPWADLFQAMGYRWYWPFRLMLIITITRLWWVLRPR